MLFNNIKKTKHAGHDADVLLHHFSNGGTQSGQPVQLDWAQWTMQTKVEVEELRLMEAEEEERA